MMTTILTTYSVDMTSNGVISGYAVPMESLPLVEWGLTS